MDAVAYEQSTFAQQSAKACGKPHMILSAFKV